MDSAYGVLQDGAGFVSWTDRPGNEYPGRDAIQLRERQRLVSDHPRLKLARSG